MKKVLFLLFLSFYISVFAMMGQEEGAVLLDSKKLLLYYYLLDSNDVIFSRRSLPWSPSNLCLFFHHLFLFPSAPRFCPKDISSIRDLFSSKCLNRDVSLSWGTLMFIGT